MPPQRTHCTSHCPKCGTCLHSVQAFDAHREGSFASNDPEVGRHCVHPLDKHGKDGRTPFITLTTVGICSMYAEERHDVTIWTLREALERARRLRTPSAGS
jgi:hypothetical protein